MLNHCLSRYKFVSTHLYHSRQWFNIHIYSNIFPRRSLLSDCSRLSLQTQNGFMHFYCRRVNCTTLRQNSSEHAILRQKIKKNSGDDRDPPRLLSTGDGTLHSYTLPTSTPRYLAFLHPVFVADDPCLHVNMPHARCYQ